MIDRSKKLLRQFSKILNADDAEAKLEELSNKLRTVNGEDFSVYADILSQFPEFFTSVDKSYEDYEAQARRANINLEKSSAELNALNSELSGLNATISTMLDTLGQGLLSFDSRGICHSSYSKACLTLLESEPAENHIAQILTSCPEMRDTIEKTIGFLFNRDMFAISYDELFALLPQKFDHSKGLTVSLDYRPIVDSEGTLRSVLVIATDHTEEINARKLGHERERAAQMILRIAANGNTFSRFFRSAYAFFNDIDEHIPATTSVEQVKRDLHTFKGNASLFCLDAFVAQIHDLENNIAHLTTVPDVRGIIVPATATILDTLRTVKTEAEKILGEGFDNRGDTRTIPLSTLRKIAKDIRTLGNAKDIERDFLSLIIGEPIHDVLSSFDIALAELADRYGKKVNRCVLHGENFAIDTELYQGVLNSLSHISRNTIAHAVEDEDIRESKGKPAHLTLNITTEKLIRDNTEWISLQFRDDGAGIHIDRLRAKLSSRLGDAAVKALSDRDVMQHIFDDDISTKDKADDLSGRGVGMSAIKYEAERLGGTVFVDSERHHFTQITIELPFKWS